MANDAANKGYVDTYKKVYYVDKNKRSNNPSWIEFPASQFLVQNWEEQSEMTYLIFISD